MDSPGGPSQSASLTQPDTAPSRSRKASSRKRSLRDDTPDDAYDASFARAPDSRKVATLASLTRKLGTYLEAADIRRIKEAYRFSDSAHLGQFRTSGEPNISNPIADTEI